MRKSPMDLSKMSDLDRKKDTLNDHISTILEENNLVRKQIPEGPGSLMKALSDCLYFTSQYHNEIQQFCTRHLRYLIANNKLPPRLSMFKGNSMLWKDFTAHPNLPGFEKIILELVSTLFKVKVVVYHISEDNYLHATTVNHKFEKTIEIIRTHGNHFDSVRSKKYMAIAGVCQNVLLNILEQALNGGGKSSTPTQPFKDMNGDVYVNLEYDSWLKQKEELAAKEGIKITRGRHKKSLSDNFNVNFDQMEEQQIKFYNMFMNNKPPDDFLKLLQKDRKETEDNLGLHADLKYLEEPWHEVPTDMAIKNYAISHSNLSSRNGSLNDLHLHEQRAEAASAKKILSPEDKIFFNDSMTNHEYQSMESKTTQPGTNPQLSSPVHFISTPPPGLTPTRYPQKTYSSEGTIFTIQTPEKAKASSQVFDYAPDMAIGSGFPMMSTPPLPGQGHLSSSSGGFWRKTPNAKNLMLETGFGSEPRAQSETNLDLIGSNAAASAEKRKPIILDEGKSRHTGRLKFFDENKNYGFIIMDDDGSDIFVHYDDLQKAGINKEFLKNARMGQVIKLGFSCMKYIGKYDKSRKATEIQLFN